MSATTPGRPHPALRLVAVPLFWAALLPALAGCASPTPTPTPVPTQTSEPTATATEPQPTETATVEPTATITPTETVAPTAPRPAAAPATQGAAAPTRRPAVPTAAPAARYVVNLWADQPVLPKDLGCTTIHWQVVGGKEVWLRWPNQDEQKVEAAGTQEGVCIDEGERAVFTLRVVKPDGANDVHEMTLERED
jgi:hypothetical protein